MSRGPGKEFQQLFKKAEQSLEYWIEGAIIEFTEEMLRRMEAKGISRSDLAKRMKVRPSYITKILKGDYNFTLESMAKIARALDTDFRIHLRPEDAQSLWFDVKPGSAEGGEVDLDAMRASYTQDRDVTCIPFVASDKEFGHDALAPVA